MWVLDDAVEITPVFDGARAGAKIRRSYLSSVICRTIWKKSRKRFPWKTAKGSGRSKTLRSLRRSFGKHRLPLCRAGCFP